MEKVVMELGGMNCPTCMDKIKTAVEHQAGVSDVKVLFNAGKLKAKVDTNQSSADDVKKVVEDLGYQVNGVKEKEIA